MKHTLSIAFVVGLAIASPAVAQVPVAVPEGVSGAVPVKVPAASPGHRTAGVDAPPGADASWSRAGQTRHDWTRAGRTRPDETRTLRSRSD